MFLHVFILPILPNYYNLTHQTLLLKIPVICVKSNPSFSQLNKKAILMALWTMASLCDKACFENSACQEHQADLNKSL